MSTAVKTAKPASSPKPAAKPKDGGTQFGSIIPFWGEFLVSPSPLEWSLNYCSHGCNYCFANLNAPTRKGSSIKALRQVADIGQRKTLTDLLLRQGYPVCIANKTDPFSESNYRETVPVLQAMKEAGVGMQFQTKGGKGIDDILPGLPPSVWYITISQHDDAIRKLIEPNAPSIPERLALIDKLIDQGHWVVVGVNPAVPEWLPNPEALMRELSERGVWGVWVERLHLSEKQIHFMSDAAKRNMGASVMQRAMSLRKEMPQVEEMFLIECGQAAMGYDMEWFTFTHPHKTDFFEPWKLAYQRTMPINHDFANYCYEEGWDETRLISFDEYVAILEAMGSPFPVGDPENNNGLLHIGDYMRVCSYMTVEKYLGRWTDKMTYRQMLYLAWIHSTAKLSPASISNFAMACSVGDDDNLVPLTDEKGIPYYVFCPRGISGDRVEYTGELFSPDNVVV